MSGKRKLAARLAHISRYRGSKRFRAAAAPVSDSCVSGRQTRRKPCVMCLPQHRDTGEQVVMNKLSDKKTSRNSRQEEFPLRWKLSSVVKLSRELNQRRLESWEKDLAPPLIRLIPSIRKRLKIGSFQDGSAAPRFSFFDHQENQKSLFCNSNEKKSPEMER